MDKEQNSDHMILDLLLRLVLIYLEITQFSKSQINFNKLNRFYSNNLLKDMPIFLNVLAELKESKQFYSTILGLISNIWFNNQYLLFVYNLILNLYSYTGYISSNP